MLAEQALPLLIQALEAQRVGIGEATARGAPTWEHYQRQVGEIRGITRAIAEARKMLKSITDPDSKQAKKEMS